MAKINTLNYQTVASWNGSQDLFVVEQPDGTKVATPAMVKQFIEAGDFEATGEIKDGHGNILKDMAKSTEIGDLSQTGLTGDSVAEQLGDANGQITELDNAITEIHPNADTVSAHVFESRTTLDDVIKIYETGSDDYKSIRIYDKNNVNRYSLIFTGGHLKFTSKNASGATIVDTTIV